jgi:ADP-ribose pyrophosphatase
VRGKDAGLPRQLLESKKIFEGAVFDVERDVLREENGMEIVRDVVRHPGGAGALPLFDDGRVALVRQYRHPARRELLEIPAGRIERGESPETCAAREVEQEIGFRAGRVEKLAEFYSTPGFCEEKLFVYLATDLTLSAQNLDHDELIEVVYLPFDEAARMAKRGEIEDSKTVIALLMTEKLRTIAGAGEQPVIGDR